MNLTKVLTTIKNPVKLFVYFTKYSDFSFMPDKMYISLFYRGMLGKRLNLKKPKTYNEKLQWLKLYYRKPELTMMVDKYEVRKYVIEKIGEKYLIPCIGVWDSFDQIPFDSFPNRFVLKCTHDSHSVIICKDKEHFNYQVAKEKLEKALKRNYYYEGRQWPYKNVKPRIIAEEFMEDAQDGELRDYKIFAFDGCAKALFIATDRSVQSPKFDYFDMDFNCLHIKQGHPNAKILPHKPEKLEEMKYLAEILSRGLPQVRVDFYEVNGNVYFGELTFFHYSGFVPFEPEEWNYIFGNWIKLPKKYR